MANKYTGHRYRNKNKYSRYNKQSKYTKSTDSETKTRHRTQTYTTVGHGYEVNTLYIVFVIIRQPVSISSISKQ